MLAVFRRLARQLSVWLECRQQNKTIETLTSDKNSHSNSVTESIVLDANLDFLDGYRGLLAAIVVVAHVRTALGLQGDLFYLISQFAHSVSVVGFFVLSAFLLTRRLLQQLSDLYDTQENDDDDDDENNQKRPVATVGSSKALATLLARYALHRLCRVYIPYCVYVSAVHAGPRWLGGFVNYQAGFGYAPWSDMIALRYAGLCHLWTVLPEVRYYACVPPLSWLAVRAVRTPSARRLLLCAGVTLALANPWLNWLRLDERHFSVPRRHELRPRFPVFFCGSLAAYACFLAERRWRWRRGHTRPSRVLRALAAWASVLTVAVGLRFFTGLWGGDVAGSQLLVQKQQQQQQLESSNNKMVGMTVDSITFESNLAVVWSLFVSLMVLGAPNFVTRLFSRSDLLRHTGRYSLGIYLLHPIAVLVARLTTFVYDVQYVLVIYACAYALGFLFHHVVERPLSAIANSISARLTFSATIAASVSHRSAAKP